MAGVPEGFIMPSLGTSLGGAVLKAYPAAETVAGALGTMTAEVVRHREFNAKKTSLLGDLPGEMHDEIELVKIKTDKYSECVLRASNLSDPKAPFYCELSTAQQIQLAELRERFRKNEHGSDTALATWHVLTPADRNHLMNLGILYVEQLAAYQPHEYYKLGNGGEQHVKNAQRHVASKQPNRQEEFEKNMAALLEAKAEERAAREEAERRYLELQEKVAALEAESAPKRGRKPKMPESAGVQDNA